jgi:serine/threonine protein kinase
MNAGVKYTLKQLHQEDDTAIFWIADCIAGNKNLGNIALKSLKDSTLYNGTWVYTFQKYVNQLILTAPPVFAPIVDYGYMDGKPYIATRFYEGVSLQQCITQLASKRLTLPTWFALPVFILLCRALRALHKGISKENPHPLMRLTPSKILFTSSGLIKILENGGFSKKLIFSDQSKYQIYQAPEVRNIGSGDIRADFYSLGAIFYELLTGRPPSLSGPGIPINALSPWVPAPFQNIIMQMLNTSPDLRPDSFDTLERALSTMYNEPLSTSEIIFIITLICPNLIENNPSSTKLDPEWEQKLRDVNFEKCKQLDLFRDAVLGKIKTSHYFTEQLHQLSEGNYSKRKLLSVVKSARTRSLNESTLSVPEKTVPEPDNDGSKMEETELNSPDFKPV